MVYIRSSEEGAPTEPGITQNFQVIHFLECFKK